MFTYLWLFPGGLKGVDWQLLTNNFHNYKYNFILNELGQSCCKKERKINTQTKLKSPNLSYAQLTYKNNWLDLNQEFETSDQNIKL